MLPCTGSFQPEDHLFPGRVLIEGVDRRRWRNPFRPAVTRPSNSLRAYTKGKADPETVATGNWRRVAGLERQAPALGLRRPSTTD